VSNGPPLLPDRLTLLERMSAIVRSLSVQNMLTIILMAIIAIPSLFAWKFMSDPQFRQDFIQRTVVVDMEVPCLVVLATTLTGPARHSVFGTYDIRGRHEWMIVARAPGLLDRTQAAALCDEVQKEIQLARDTLREIDQRARDALERAAREKIGTGAPSTPITPLPRPRGDQ
jgi:hypothetical protein